MSRGVLAPLPRVTYGTPRVAGRVSRGSKAMTSTEGTETTEPPEEASPPAPSETSVADIARLTAALAMLGAAVIHFAFAPDHLSEQTSHGVFFLVVGWSQLVGAAALAFSWRPARTWLLGSAALNLGVAALWLLTRTAGLPGEEPEAVAFPDALASGLEVIAAAGALAVALRVAGRSPGPRAGAGDHRGVGGGHDGGRHRLGRARRSVAGTATATATATAGTAPARWPPAGHAHGAGDAERAPARRGRSSASPRSTAYALRRRDRGGARRATRSTSPSRSAPVPGRCASCPRTSGRPASPSSSSGRWPTPSRPRRRPTVEATMHSHGVDVWQPLTDPAEITELQEQLQAAGTVIPAMATAADALAAGYMQVTPYVPGIGAHYLNIDLLRRRHVRSRQARDAALQRQLARRRCSWASATAGWATSPPKGSSAPTTSGTSTRSSASSASLVVGPDSTPEDLCDSVGGRKGMGFDHPMWMGHLWQVPGWESPWGLFSGENPVINLATTDGDLTSRARPRPAAAPAAGGSVGRVDDAPPDDAAADAGRPAGTCRRRRCGAAPPPGGSGRAS